MCVCVFWNPCAQNFFWIERLFWEIIVLIGSLVELYVGLHSCLCFSPLEKLFWKAGFTPPRYLFICQASQAFFLSQSRQLLDTWWIDWESSCLLDSSLTPGGLIELLFLKLILCCSIPQLSTTTFSTPPLTASSIPPDTLVVEHYWRSYLYLLCDLSLISSISLDLSAPVHLPNTLSFTPNLFLKLSSSFFMFLYTW